MKRFISLILLVVLLAPNLSFAEEFVKEVPKKYQKELGANYLLVDEDFLRDLTAKAEEAEVLTKKVDEILADLDKHKTYSMRLEEILKEEREHIVRLNFYIDDQERIIKSLQPTFWDKNKFMFGILTGVVITGGAAYAVGQID